MTCSDLEHTLMIIQLLPFSKWHFSKKIPIIPNPIALWFLGVD
jgi:hypothetical protein